MKVESKDARQEKPEECDWCHTRTKALRRFSYFGPGYNVDWLCPYCSVDFRLGQDTVINSMAAMFNVLEKRLSSGGVSR